MKGIASNKVWAFVGAHVLIAILINSYLAGMVNHSLTRSRFESVPSSLLSQQTTPDPAELARRAKEDSARQHQEYLARHLNPGVYSRKSGTRTIAIVVVSEYGNFNPPVATAFANRVKGDSIEILPSLFTLQFVMDGLFDQTWNTSAHTFKALDLPNFLDAVMFARQRVQYSTNTSLENVITANMQMDVLFAPVVANQLPQAWTFSANGAGFHLHDARTLAEERLIKQVANDPRLAPDRISQGIQIR